MDTNQETTIEYLCKRLKEEILPMFEKAVSNDDVRFSNSNLVKCREHLNCKSTDCQLYSNGSGKKEVRCWQIAGTYCGGEPQGSFVQKYGKCSNCEVFKDSCPTIVEELGEHFNNMLFLLNKQNQALLDDKQQIEDLNQELLTALEQLKKKNSEFQKVLVTDSLTGLFNRQNLLPVLEDEIGRCHRYGHYLALMKIDIDKFKSFNDEYGYSTGDKMLAYAGKIIRKNIRKFDKAFRYSGEEFIVVLPETDQTLAYIAAERIRKSFQNKTFAVSKKKSQSGKSTSCTISIGITALFSYKTSDLSIEELINQSNAALNAAKEKGGNISVRYE